MLDGRRDAHVAPMCGITGFLQPIGEAESTLSERVDTTPSEWTVEIAIPWSEMQAPAPAAGETRRAKYVGNEPLLANKLGGQRPFRASSIRRTSARWSSNRLSRLDELAA